MENLSARVKYANTPYSDAMAVVDHVVNWTADGEHHSMTVLAECPMTAIEKVRRVFSE
tara:strand:+ start:138 stop:311 length:174 start_codon:yes stop_codon:yes gene_type:complete